jgi:predicted nucleotidyltransferase
VHYLTIHQKSDRFFGLKVDIVTKNGLKPRIRERVLAEAIYI